MDFRQLEAFIKVVELAGFSKAAEELHISQPSVSTYILSLERELNATLINRSTRMLSTTLAGERFLEKARAMLALRQEAVEILKGMSKDANGAIHVLASSVPAMYLLPQIIADFHHLYPGISFHMNQADTAEVIRAIAARSADIGFAGSLLEDKSCDFYPFASESLLFIAPVNGLYTGSRKYGLEELLYSGRFISREPGSGTRREYEKFFAENGVLLDNIQACASMDNTHSIVNAVINGLGISMVSEHAARRPVEQKLLLPLKLKNAIPERKIYAVVNKTIVRSHLVQLFMEYLQAERPVFTAAGV